MRVVCSCLQWTARGRWILEMFCGAIIAWFNIRAATFNLVKGRSASQQEVFARLGIETLESS